MLKKQRMFYTLLSYLLFSENIELILNNELYQLNGGYQVKDVSLMVQFSLEQAWLFWFSLLPYILCHFHYTYPLTMHPLLINLPNELERFGASIGSPGLCPLSLLLKKVMSITFASNSFSNKINTVKILRQTYTMLFSIQN